MDKLKKTKNKGFTFLELLVVLSIFSILSAITLFRFSDFNKLISLNNITQEMALYVKKAQTESSSGRVQGLSGSMLQEPPSYGVYFRTLSDSFVYFRDFSYSNISQNNLFGGENTPELLETISFGVERYISDICYRTSLSGNCTSISGKGVHITFERPYLDATIMVDGLGYPVASVEITVSTLDGASKKIIVYAIGHIRVL